MEETLLCRADPAFFAACHALYAPQLEPYVPWQEAVAPSPDAAQPFFLISAGTRIGGIRLDAEGGRDVFLFPTFSDRPAFWELLLGALDRCPVPWNGSFFGLEDRDVRILRNMGARVVHTQRRMYRVTEANPYLPPEGMALRPVRPEDLAAAARIAFEAHHRGYTSKVQGPLSMEEHRQALARRFYAFAATRTLSMGTMAWEEATGQPLGIAIAGIYPDTRNGFSTLHQCSVLPGYWRRGIARAMIAHVLTRAVSHAPVMTLGVLCGNPAERLYAQMGFAPGPAYTHLTWAPEERSLIRKRK